MRAVARTTDPSTSHRAAKSLSNEHLTSVREAVFWILSEAKGGLCDKELVDVYNGLQKEMGWEPTTDSSIRTRRNELGKQGRVYHTGRKTSYKGSYPSIIWKAKP